MYSKNVCMVQNAVLYKVHISHFSQPLNPSSPHPVLTSSHHPSPNSSLLIPPHPSPFSPRPSPLTPQTSHLNVQPVNLQSSSLNPTAYSLNALPSRISTPPPLYPVPTLRLFMFLRTRDIRINMRIRFGGQRGESCEYS